MRDCLSLYTPGPTSEVKLAAVSTGGMASSLAPTRSQAHPEVGGQSEKVTFAIKGSQDEFATRFRRAIVLTGRASQLSPSRCAPGRKAYPKR
jgi:hypothetical protein